MGHSVWIYMGRIMSAHSELHAEQQGQDDMMECYYAHEEQAFHNAVQEVKGFIDSGAVTFEQVEKILREMDNVGH